MKNSSLCDKERHKEFDDQPTLDKIAIEWGKEEKPTLNIKKKKTPKTVTALN